MSMIRIREYYRVPARRGMRVVVNGRPGVITGSSGKAMHILVRFDGDAYSQPCHPTWEVEYPEVVDEDRTTR